MSYGGLQLGAAFAPSHEMVTCKGAKHADKSGRRSLWGAVARDTAGELSEAISRPGGATDISRWRSAAQPPGQTKRDFSRPGGATDQYSRQKQPGSGALSGRVALL